MAMCQAIMGDCNASVKQAKSTTNMKPTCVQSSLDSRLTMRQRTHPSVNTNHRVLRPFCWLPRLVQKVARPPLWRLLRKCRLARPTTGQMTTRPSNLYAILPPKSRLLRHPLPPPRPRRLPRRLRPRPGRGRLGPGAAGFDVAGGSNDEGAGVAVLLVPELCPEWTGRVWWGLGGVRRSPLCFLLVLLKSIPDDFPNLTTATNNATATKY
jgi:hypothetical protein